MENLQFIEYLPYEEIQKRFEKMSDGAVAFFVSQGGYPYVMVRIKDSFLVLFQDNENVKAMTEDGAAPLEYKELPQAFTAMIDEIKGNMEERTVTAARHYFAGCWTMFQKGLTEDVLQGILQNDCPKEEGVVVLDNPIGRRIIVATFPNDYLMFYCQMGHCVRVLLDKSKSVISTGESFSVGKDIQEHQTI